MITPLKRTLLILAGILAAMTFAVPAFAQNVTGDWVGVLEPMPGNRVPLVIHIKRDASGTLSGTLDSPLQNVQGLVIADATSNAGSFAFTVPKIFGSYQGQWDAASKTWKGEWSQGGKHLPIAFFVPPPPTALPANWQLPSDEAIGKLIASRNAPRPGQGIVVGMLGPDGPRFIAGGTGAGAKVDRTTLFEIGSISKVFTALILADMVNKGEVSLDDPAAKYLPKGHHLPERNGKQITLRDLSTHHSGLPRMPDDMRPVSDIDGPFYDYGEDKLLAFLDRYQLTRDIGSKWEYSNLGVGLLGYLLGRAAHSDYEMLVSQRITGPLGMKDTFITLPPNMAARQAAPFDAYMQPAKTWNFGMFAAAGGIRSDAVDMLIFARAVLDPKSPIAAAEQAAVSVKVSGEAPSVEQALGWEIAHPEQGRDLLLHGGQSGGYRTMLALEPAKQRAAVVLINSAAEPSATDLGLHLLLGSPVAPTPAIPPAPAH